MSAQVRFHIPKESYLLFLIQFLVSCFLLFLPITRYFSYESAIINSFLLALLTGFIFLHIPDREGAGSGDILFIVLLLFSIEPVVRLIQSSIVESCSYLHGLKFYFIGAMPAAGVSFFLSQIIKQLITRYRYLVFFVILLCLVCEPLFQFYFLSQVYFYNPVIFFFPGTIYDELIRFDIRLLSHRVFSVLGFAVIYIMMVKSKTSRLKILIPPAGVLLYYVTFAPLFGYITTDDTLLRNGYTFSRTSNFIIHHPTGLPENLIDELKSFHEFQLRELKEKLQVSARYPITSYVYKNSSDKGQFFGSEGADVAKPWKKEIHTSMGTVFGSLRHELAHILASEFSNPPFYVAGGIDPWLIEGLAVFADFSFDDQDIPDLLYGMSKISGHETINSAGKASFFQTNTRYAYLKAGFIFDEIQKSHGTDKLKELYRTGDFQTVLHTSPDKIFEQAIVSEAKELSGRDSVAAAYYFKSKPFLLKNCPRFMAEQFDDAIQALKVRDFNSAEYTLKNLLLANKDSRYITTYAGLLEETNRYEDLYKFSEALEKDYSDINIRLKKIDAKILSGRGVSESDYQSLIHYSPNLRYDAILQTRLILLKKGTLKQYLSADDSGKKTMLLSELNDTTGYLLLPFSNLASPEEVLSLIRNFSKPGLWTEYVKLFVARRSISAGDRLLFINALKLIRSDFLPSGSKKQYEQLIRYNSYLLAENLLKEK